MLQMTESMLGLESLAIMLSVPFALLIWGCVTGQISSRDGSFLAV